MDPKAAASALASPDFGVGANPVLQIDPMAQALQQQGGVGMPVTPAVPTQLRPKVNLERHHQEEGEMGGTASSYNFLNPAGQTLGGVSVDFDPATNRLYIPWVGLTKDALPHFGKTYDPEKSMYDQVPNLLGLANMRAMLRALMKDYPEAETIVGERVSGARQAYEDRTGQDSPTKWFSMRVKKPTISKAQEELSQMLGHGVPHPQLPSRRSD